MSEIRSSRWGLMLPEMTQEERHINYELKAMGKEVREAMEEILPRRRIHWGALKSYAAVTLVTGPSIGDLLYKKDWQEAESNRKVSLWLTRRNKENSEPISLIGFDRDTLLKPLQPNKKLAGERSITHIVPEEAQNLKNVMATVNHLGLLVDPFAMEQTPSRQLVMLQYVHDTLPLIFNQQSDETVRMSKAPVRDLGM